MLLCDPDVFFLPTALAVRAGQEYHARLRESYPGWTDDHLTPRGYVAMTADAAGTLVFWIPTREGREAPGVDFWKAFWGRLRGLASARDGCRETHLIRDWSATLTRGEPDTSRPQHHAYADLGFEGSGAAILIKNCPARDLKSLGVFLTRYASDMEKGNTP